MCIRDRPCNEPAFSTSRPFNEPSFQRAVLSTSRPFNEPAFQRAVQYKRRRRQETVRTTSRTNKEEGRKRGGGAGGGGECAPRTVNSIGGGRKSAQRPRSAEHFSTVHAALSTWRMCDKLCCCCGSRHRPEMHNAPVICFFPPSTRSNAELE